MCFNCSLDVCDFSSVKLNYDLERECSNIIDIVYNSKDMRN